MSTYTERWDAILAAILGAPATAEQKAMYENGVGLTQVMNVDGIPWAEMTAEQKAEVSVNYTHTNLTGLARQYEYNNAMKAASDSAQTVDDALKQTEETPAAARASKAVKPSRK